jgi:hypothetical protein
MVWDESTYIKTGRWLLASFIGMAILLISGWISPDFYPEGDSQGYVRELFAVGGPMVIRSIVGMGIVLFFLLIPRKNWFDQIENIDYGPTAVISMFLYCVLHG